MRMRTSDQEVLRTRRPEKYFFSVGFPRFPCKNDKIRSQNSKPHDITEWVLSTPKVEPIVPNFDLHPVSIYTKDLFFTWTIQYKQLSAMNSLGAALQTNYCASFNHV